MAIVSLILGSFKNTVRTSISYPSGKNANGSVNSVIILDTLDKESFNAPAEPTNHPVEVGGDATDHIILKPKKLSIEGTITSTPFGLGGLIRGTVSSVGAQIGAGLGSALGNVTKSLGGAGGAIAGGLAGKTLAGLLGQDGDRDLQDAVNQFVAIRDTRQPISVQTGLKLYSNYVLSNFTASRDKTTGGSIKVSLELQEFMTASTVTQLVSLPIPKKKNALAKNEQGRKGLTDVADNGKNRTWLRRIEAGIFGN